MPQKTPSIKKKKQRQLKKTSMFSKFIYIIFALIIVIAFLILNFYTPKNSNPRKNKVAETTNSSPSFRIDGSLHIFRSNKEAIRLDIEIADEEEERMKGLMYRYHLPEDAGMFFIFEKDEPRSFWMKNTHISLDIIYINSGMEVVSIQKYTHPRTTYSIPSEKPARFVLEVNAGFTDKHGISPGDKIEFDY